MSANPTCAVCGRSILAGERVHDHLERGEGRTVCELCLGRAEQLGWRPAGEPEPAAREMRAHEGRWRLGTLLRHRPRRPGASQSASPAAPATPAAPAAPPDPAATPRHRRSPAADPEMPTPFQRAVARFNSSPPGHTVAGLTRTLGTPRASLGASAGVPGEVRITVAWELSWYQWGVDLDDELRPVFPLGKGTEITQLDAAARQWNAAVSDDGRLRLAGEPAPTR